MDQALKTKIHNSMKHWLVLNGWPDKLTNDQIIANLPNIWKKLESEGLLKDLIAKGFSYGQFVRIAINSKQTADMRRVFEEKMRGFGFK